MENKIEMRTRILTAMTNWEVEEYLKRNDIILVPVGVQEMHGAMPLDVEYLMAEANARIIAEQVDGLVLPSLVYFSAGGTVIGRGTVYMSMEDSIKYIKSICYSLINQGFRRIALLPAHGNSSIIIGAVVADVFDETKIPIMYLPVMEALTRNKVNRPTTNPNSPLTEGDILGCNTMVIGTYKICGRIDDIPTGEYINNKPGVLSRAAKGHQDAYVFEAIPEFEALSEITSFSYLPIALYFSDPDQHGSGLMPWTKEDVYREGEIGEKAFREMMSKVDWKRYFDGVREADKFFQEVVLPKYGDVLPKNKFYPNITNVKK